MGPPTPHPLPLDAVDRLHRRADELLSRRRETDETGSTVVGIGHPFDVASMNQLGDDLSDRLMSQAGPCSEHREPGAVGVEVLEDRMEARRAVRESGGVEPGCDLVDHLLRRSAK